MVDDIAPGVISREATYQLQPHSDSFPGVISFESIRGAAMVLLVAGDEIIPQAWRKICQRVRRAGDARGESRTQRAFMGTFFGPAQAPLRGSERALFSLATSESERTANRILTHTAYEESTFHPRLRAPRSPP
jgi:hypothetical protein